MNQMILHPGEYFIELEFDRPVEPSVLHKALTSMGFGIVVFDQSLPSVEIGAGAAATAFAATAAKATVAASSMKRVAVAPVTSRYSAASTVATAAPVAAAVKPAAPAASTIAAPAIPVAAVKPAPAPSTTLAVEAATKLTAVATKPNPGSAVAYADGGIPAALKTTPVADAVNQRFPAIVSTPVKKSDTSTSSSPAAPVYTPASAPTASAPAASTPSNEPIPFPGDVPAAPTPSAAAPAPPEPKGEFVAPAPAGPTYEEQYHEEPSSYAADAAPSPESVQVASPTPQAAAPSPVAQAASRLEPQRDPKVLHELWTKWKEWGSPFASGPNVSGEGDDDPLRFRVLARLDRPIALDDRPGMRWLFVKALSIPFLSDLVFQAHPHALKQGALYEIRFLSRAKSNRTRDSVKQELTNMGWKPIKLSAIKRNMTLPRRPASLTLWYGMAVWNHADSVIVNDDPFFFETVKEIRP